MQVSPIVTASLAEWSVQMRLCLYLSIVDESEREDGCALLGRSAFAVSRSLCTWD